MTDRYYAYTVILEEPLRDDDAEGITNAIGMIKGVAEVTPLVANPEVYWGISKARREVAKALWDVLYPEREK